MESNNWRRVTAIGGQIGKGKARGRISWEVAVA